MKNPFITKKKKEKFCAFCWLLSIWKASCKNNRCSKKSDSVTRKLKMCVFFRCPNLCSQNINIKEFCSSRYLSGPLQSLRSLIENWLISPGFCWKLGKLILDLLGNLYWLNKKSYTKMSNRLTFIKWCLVCVSICSIASVFNKKPLHFLFEHPI